MANGNGRGGSPVVPWEIFPRQHQRTAGITVRGSIVGTRLDLQEALAFAGAGQVKATVAA